MLDINGQLAELTTRFSQNVLADTNAFELLLSSEEELAELPGGEQREALPPPPDMTGREKAAYLARQDLDKTTDQIRGWLTEAS
jgi:hypothetical protein